MSHTNSSDEQAIPPLPKQVGTGPTGRGVVSAAGALASSVVPGIAVPVAGVTAALQAFGAKLNEHQEARIDETIQEASRAGGLTPEEVISHCMDDENRMLLFAEAVDAARRTRLKSKPKLLGRSLGNLLTDDALIDQEAIWIRILSAVEPPHVRVLTEFMMPNVLRDGGVWMGRPSMVVSGIAYRLGLHEAILPLIQDLHGSGLLMVGTTTHELSLSEGNFETPSGYDQELKATGLGVELMNRLEEERDEN
ncbi:hypothetical protein [Arthrobacter sp. D5-1]|uniref:hypothetical protein n=1 Tax=Arthrobacter sp. D5-1 TaxID=1477518 RepID=UPI001A987274|nr:hypothetical protein [Arthrobacter sp. D5-1]QSZ47206.1 hypothetical protein AYX22_01445 [Arthrobacter sp. D5-1]